MNLNYETFDPREAIDKVFLFFEQEIEILIESVNSKVDENADSLLNELQHVANNLLKNKKRKQSLAFYTSNRFNFALTCKYTIPLMVAYNFKSVSDPTRYVSPVSEIRRVCSKFHACHIIRHCEWENMSYTSQDIGCNTANKLCMKCYWDGSSSKNLRVIEQCKRQGCCKGVVDLDPDDEYLHIHRTSEEEHLHFWRAWRHLDINMFF
jgi:hypothetical protein